MFSKSTIAVALTASAIAQAATLVDKRADSTTITLFGIPSPSGFAGSVISADCSETTFQYSCTNDNNDVCGTIGTIPITLTEGPSTYQWHFTGTVANGASGVGSESCSFNGALSTASQAVCVLSAEGSADGQSTAFSTTVTLSGTNIPRNPLAITAGASKLPSSSCTASGNAAVATGLTEVYKVLVPVGAALVGAAMI